MKKIIIFIFPILLFLAGCNYEPDVTNYINETINNYSEKSIILNLGEKIDLGKEYLSSFKFDKVEFESGDQNIARINYKEELIALNQGKTYISAYLYNHQDQTVKKLDLGIVCVVDIPSFTAINSIRELLSIKHNGFYYLANDLDFNDYTNWVDPISSFEGILINPGKYKIRNLKINSNGNCGLFKETNHAFIDGLILENVKINNDFLVDLNIKSSVGGLVGEAYESYFNNIQITGELSGYSVGGIVGYLYKSTINRSSFTGKISSGYYMGGLIGVSDSKTVDEILKLSKILNSFAIVEFVGENYIGGLIGMMDGGGMLKSCYFNGVFNFTKCINSSPIANGMFKGNYYFEDVYIIVPNYTDLVVFENFLFSKYYKTNIARFFNVFKEENFLNLTYLYGFEEFAFSPGSFPKIKE